MKRQHDTPNTTQASRGASAPGPVAGRTLEVRGLTPSGSPGRRIVCLSVLILSLSAVSNSTTRADEADDLAAMIDRHVSARWQEQKIEPAAVASDAQFLRRVWLDLGGRDRKSVV